MKTMVISECLKLYRQSRGLGIREVAKEIGISTASLSRIENGKEVLFPQFAKLLNWLMLCEVPVNKPHVERKP